MSRTPCFSLYSGDRIHRQGRRGCTRQPSTGMKKKRPLPTSPLISFAHLSEPLPYTSSFINNSSLTLARSDTLRDRSALLETSSSITTHCFPARRHYRGSSTTNHNPHCARQYLRHSLGLILLLGHDRVSSARREKRPGNTSPLPSPSGWSLPLSFIRLKSLLALPQTDEVRDRCR